ncbi:WYL domain-containing protein [Kitasatospora sp. NBC_01302]|uniref:WYL domain-containing protein n=1 Tax=Kitasatospora sp. NBC_01302 TaxID=2903575 RepID=UPI002E110571|nr:WYL domain-containing protein [Kitasatospora sp. NBC_01302]
MEPAGLLTADGRWCLIAWCRTRRAGRGFRLDRVTAAPPTDEPAQPHDLNALLLGSARGERRVGGRVRVTPPGPPRCVRGRRGAR